MKGILVNNEYCTNCHSCEVACKKYLKLPKGEFGIKVSEVGPYEITQGNGTGKERWEWLFVPAVTKQCNLCEDRVEKGKLPMCIQHCQAWCMYYGEVEDLVKKVMPGTRWTLLTK
jgi:Fe-S-cluster-containing dehydrogenase component